MSDSTIPHVRDGFDGNPVVAEVALALRALGATDTQTAAAELLTYPHAGELTERETAAVLRRFPPSTEDTR